MSGNGVISNEAGRCKSLFLCFIGRIEHTSSSAQELRLFLELIHLRHPQLLRSSRSSTRCCPPVISSIINDHDEFFDLPV